MKHILLLSLLVTANLSLHAQEKINIGSNCQVEINERMGSGFDVDPKDFYISLSLAGSLTDSLKHVAKGGIADCSSISWEIGDFVLDSNSISLYSYFNGSDRTRMVSRYGAFKEIYLIDVITCKLFKKSSVVYLYSDPTFFSGGSKFLYDKIKTQNDKLEFLEYISIIEKEFDSIFVFGADSDRLIQEVNEVMRVKINLLMNDLTSLYTDDMVFSRVIKKKYNLQ